MKIFEPYKNHRVEIKISEKALIGAFCLRFHMSRRYCLDLLKIFEDGGQINIVDEQIEVLK